MMENKKKARRGANIFIGEMGSEEKGMRVSWTRKECKREKGIYVWRRRKMGAWRKGENKKYG